MLEAGRGAAPVGRRQGHEHLAEVNKGHEDVQDGGHPEEDLGRARGGRVIKSSAAVVGF